MKDKLLNTLTNSKVELDYKQVKNNLKDQTIIISTNNKIDDSNNKGKVDSLINHLNDSFKDDEIKFSNSTLDEKGNIIIKYSLKKEEEPKFDPLKTHQ